MNGAPVSLEEVLANRERRALRQRTALEAFGRPVLSITLVVPGPVKDFPEARALMDEAICTLYDVMAVKGWAILDRQIRLELTGPEALLVVDADGMELKRAVAGLEERHPLGRLWDLDVIDSRRGSLSRRTLDLPPRRCLLCGDEAHTCARSRAHPLPQLMESIKEKVRAYPVRSA